MMSDPVVSGNGAGAHDPMDEMIESLEAMRAPLAARRDELELELSELNAKEERIGNAIRALNGQAPGATPAPKRRRRSLGEVGANSGGNWVPREDKIERVLAALRASGPAPTNSLRLSEKTGLSRETVNRAVRVLREREQARLVGQAGPGNAHLFLAMEN